MTKILLRAIERQGVIPFVQFMEWSLYRPKHGYYERKARERIGREGDYYTSVSTSSLFGELLAFQFAQWLTEVAGPSFQLVEAGAHDGSLAADILTWLHKNRSAIALTMEYWIVEPSAERQTWQRRKVEDFAGQVLWFDSLASLPPTGIHGVIFSNELLDAMPVRRVGWDARTGAWFEWGVRAEKDRFVWAEMPDAGDDLTGELKQAGLDLPQSLLEALPDGFTIELCPAAAAWWKNAAMALREGRLMTIDYGLTAEQFLVPERSRGTLRAYQNHHLQPDVLAHAGEQDLTAHVNFTHLQTSGEAAGLLTEGLFSQEQYMTRIAQQAWADDSSFGELTPARVRQFQTLTHPEHLGRSFKVFVQSRHL